MTAADERVDAMISPQSQLPCTALRPYVDLYRGYHYVGPPMSMHRGLPSSALTVVISFGRPLDLAWHGAPATRTRLWSVASGLHTTAADIFHAGEQCGIQLGLTFAGARALLGFPMAELARIIAPLDDVLSGRSFAGWHDRIAAQPTWAGRYEELERLLMRALSARADSFRDPRAEVVWASRRLAAGPTRVEEVAQEVGWSRRHLSAQFASEMGLTPKEFARVVRLERSRIALAAGTPLSAVAAEHGFSDQAHLTREWRAMTGYTPGQWLREEFPFLQDRIHADEEVFAS